MGGGSIVVRAARLRAEAHGFRVSDCRIIHQFGFLPTRGSATQLDVVPTQLGLETIVQRGRARVVGQHWRFLCSRGGHQTGARPELEEVF